MLPKGLTTTFTITFADEQIQLTHAEAILSRSKTQRRASRYRRQAQTSKSVTTRFGRPYRREKRSGSESASSKSW